MLETPISEAEQRFEDQLQRLVETFAGPIAIVLNGTLSAASPNAPLDILVPSGGTPDARLAIEMAIALAKASNGTLTVLHVFDPQKDTDLFRRRARRQGRSILVDAHRLGKRSGVAVKGITVVNARPEAAIRRVTRAGGYGLSRVQHVTAAGQHKVPGFAQNSVLLRVLQTPVLMVAR